MLLRKLAAITALGCAAAVPAVASAKTDTFVPAQCLVGNRQVTSVTKYKVNRPTGKNSYPTTGGAVVRIEAEPGLTAEWLRVDLGQRMKECGVSSKDVDVQVAPARTGFDVKLIARHWSTASDVYHQALLVE